MRGRRRVPAGESVEEIRAHGRLPNADIGIVYRRARTRDAAFIGVSIQPVPPSQAFGRLLAVWDPFRFWGPLVAAAWRPWLHPSRAVPPPAPVRRLRSGRKG